MQVLEEAPRPSRDLATDHPTWPATGWPWKSVSVSPWIIADTGIGSDKIRAEVDRRARTPHGPAHRCRRALRARGTGGQQL